MTQEILNKVTDTGVVAYPGIVNHEKFVAYLAGAKRGYELAMETLSKTHISKYEYNLIWDALREATDKLNDSPTPEPGKEYTREFAKDFAEWVDNHTEVYDNDSHLWLAGLEKYNYKTTDQLLTEYLNSNK